MFTVTTSRGMYRGHELVIATGGKSYPGTGSTGDGYRFAQALGHTVTPLKPSLVPVHVRDYPFSDLSGISFREVTLSLFREGKKVHEHAGDLLFTHSGLSGPGILDLSRYIEPGDTLKISFLPKKRREAFFHELAGKLLASGTLKVRTILAGYQLPERFIDKVLTLSGIPPELTGAHLSVPARKRLVESLAGFPCVIAGSGSFEEAMVTRGGISLDEVDPKTMESRLVSGLYFTGEVLDIDGDTGGYNIQAAFSTGVLAAQSILKRIWSGQQQKKC
jgi:predicted Rossmann fold flavoprotein